MAKPEERAQFWSGQSIELHTLDGQVFESQIVKIDEPHHLFIQNPASFRQQGMSVPHDEPVVVYAHDDKLGLCSFKTTIRLQQERFALAYPANDAIKRVQRRRYFRVPVAVEVELALGTDAEGSEPDRYRLTTRDLSGGGFSFGSPYAWKDKQPVEGTLRLKTNGAEQPVPFKGKIVNSVKQDEQVYRVSIEFADMKEAVRSLIIKFCLGKQIEQRNKLKQSQV